MKKIILIMMFTTLHIYAQGIGQLAPDKKPEIFPQNSWGVDVMFGEGGFGLGTFLRHSFTNNLSGFVDLSLSETKDEREIEYIDYFGNTFSPNKINRSYFLPINFGAQYRILSETLTDNLRPYITAGVGPTLVIYAPYFEDVFSDLAYAKIKYAAGGYIGFGANFGISKSNLVGINVRYYHTYIFGDGIENLKDVVRKNFGQFYISLNLGVMY
jgi:outer membrane protein W